MLLHLIVCVLLVGTVLGTSGRDPWAQNMLKAHNIYRERHGSPPLVYDDNLAHYAQLRAQHHSDHSQFVHGKHREYGENSFRHSHNKTGVDALMEWYKEIKEHKNYNVDPLTKNGGVNSKAEHFTQVVWKGSKALGCGHVYTKEKGTNIVCYYNPPGNVKGAFPANVHPPVTRRGHGSRTHSRNHQ